MVDWIISDGLTDYETACAYMEERAAQIAAGTAPEAIWLLEHPPLYTAGTSARPADLTAPDRFPVHMSKRGGQYTYHGPGQRVAYVMLEGARDSDTAIEEVYTAISWTVSTSRERFAKAASGSGWRAMTNP